MSFWEEALPAGRQERQIEKRRFSRIPFREAIQYKILGDSAPSCGSVSHDLSETGVRIQLGHFVPINSEIVLNFPLKETSGSKIVTIHGRVAWVQHVRYSEWYQVGLEFSESEKLIYEHVREKALPPAKIW